MVVESAKSCPPRHGRTRWRSDQRRWHEQFRFAASWRTPRRGVRSFRTPAMETGPLARRFGRL